MNFSRTYFFGTLLLKDMMQVHYRVLIENSSFVPPNFYVLFKGFFILGLFPIFPLLQRLGLVILTLGGFLLSFYIVAETGQILKETENQTIYFHQKNFIQKGGKGGC